MVSSARKIRPRSAPPEVAWSMKRLATSGVTTCTPMVPHRITASRPIRGHWGRR